MNGRRAHHAIGSWIFHDMKCRPSNERLIFGWEERVPIDMSPTLITISPDHSHVRLSIGEMGMNDRIVVDKDREGKNV